MDALFPNLGEALTLALLGLLGLLGAVPPVMLGWKLRRYVQAEVQGPTGPKSHWPEVLAILPCKGTAGEMPQLEANFRAVLEQVYPCFRLIFALGDANDLAAPLVRKLCRQYPHTSLVFADNPRACSQKVGNLLKALECLSDKDDVIVFLDSDARPGPSLLQQLVQPLAQANVGVSTGFRWYTPSAGAGWGSWLRAAWNAGGMAFLADARHNYAWGGAMAVKRDVFDRCGVAKAWQTSLSDDLMLSRLIKTAGWRIAFVPQALVRSPEDLTLRQTWEWTSRQTIILRAYNRRMWRDIFLGELYTWMVLSLAAGGAVMGGGMAAAQAGMVIAAMALGRMIYQAQVVKIVYGIAPALVSRQAKWRLVALAPLVSPLVLANSVWSCWNRRISWRGVSYRLNGPDNMQVISTPAACPAAIKITRAA